LLEKTERPDVYKDTSTNTIVNKDINKLNEYKQKKKLMQKTTEVSDEIRLLRNEIAEIKKMVADMYSMLGDNKWP